MQSPHAVHIQNRGEAGQGAFADRDFARGEIVLQFPAKFVSHPDRYTIQLDFDKHLDTEGSLGSLFNHSCAANCAFDSEKLCYIARKPIAVNEELTFNYLTTEWKMAQPFNCLCQTKNCLGFIGGYSLLSSSEAKLLEGQLTPYLASYRHLGPRHPRRGSA